MASRHLVGQVKEAFPQKNRQRTSAVLPDVSNPSENAEPSASDDTTRFQAPFGTTQEEADDGDVVDVQEEEQPGAEMDILSALKVVLKKALLHDGLARGLRECVKALDRREAHLCVIASNCTEPAYERLVSALCKEHNIFLLKVPENKKLGEWAGLCKLDATGTPRKVVGASCVVVKNYGETSPELDFLLNHLKNQK